MLEKLKDDLDDFLVHITDLEPAAHRYQVHLTLDNGRNFQGHLSLQNLDAPQDGDAQAIAAYGLDLFQRLFAPPLDYAFQQAWAAAQAHNHGLRMRLWLDSTAPALHEIPWELLHYDASGGRSRPLPLATDGRVAFSRYLSSPEPWGEPVEYRPLRLFILVSAPTDLATDWPDLVPLNKESEVRGLTASLGAMRRAGQLRYDDPLRHGSEEDINAALDDGYDVLLYFGHALNHPQAGTRLVLEDEITGEAVLYDGAELVRRVRQAKQRPRLLVLVACNTARSTSTTASGVHLSAPASLAAQLVQEGGIPAVLAMQDLVEVTMARTFSHRLRELLVRHGVVDVAVNTVRQQIYQADSTRWSTPVLYMRSRSGQLFAPNARLEYVQMVHADSRFLRWQGAEFIRLEAITIASGQPWHIYDQRPQDVPPTEDALNALRTALRIDSDQSQASLVALLGQPRSGQSTTLQRLTWDLADEVRLNPASQRPVAVFVPLTGYEHQRGSDRLEQIIIQTVSPLVPALATELQHLFRQSRSGANVQEALSRYVFLLDDLDTIPASHREAASREIVALFERSPGLSIVVSSEQNIFPVPLFPMATVVLLQPLTERQIHSYVQQRDPERAARLLRHIAENQLLDVATDPLMLRLIYERLSANETTILTRNRLLQDWLDEALSRMHPRYIQGDAAFHTLTTLAWEMRWRQVEQIRLQDLFVLLAEVRRERDYNLEDLYDDFRQNQLLIEAGGEMVRFLYPALQSYCAALALANRSDFQERLNDIVALCGVSERLHWWQDVLYALAGMLDTAIPLNLLAVAAVRNQSSNHTLLMARSLKALSEQVQQNIPDEIRRQLLDVCAFRLYANREPAAERRAQIAEALGYLNYPDVVDKLGRVLANHVRPTPHGWLYDLSRVRLAAARALRVLFTSTTRAAKDQPEPAPPGMVQVSGPDTQPQHHTGSQLLVLGGGLPDTPDDTTNPWIARLQPPKLRPLFAAWVEGAAGRPLLRATLEQEKRSPLEYSVAAFALGDLAADVSDAELLIDIIVRACPWCPDTFTTTTWTHEWAEMVWCATDALTLFDHRLVSDLLVRFFAEERSVPRESLEQMIYLVGRVRVQDDTIQHWLFTLLRTDRDHMVKARALQSLGWLSKSMQSVAWIEPLLTVIPLHWLTGQDPAMSVVLRVVQAIAVWDTRVLDAFGTFDKDDDRSEATMFLRQKALETLALIGTAQTLDTVYTLVPDLPVELREAWYLSAASIRARAQATAQS